MPIFTRFLCCLLAAIFLVACNGSDSNSNSNSNSNNAAIDPPIEPTEPTEPPPSIFSQMTVNIPSAANPAFTPGTPGVMVDNEKLLSQFGSADINLNQARYTRYFLSDRAGTQPDGILVLIPGFEGGASGFYLLAENLLRRAAAETNLVLEVWAFDRRSNQLEDTVGLDIAEGLNDPLVGLDFLFGDELGLELSQPLIDGPNRRAVFYNNNSDIAFMAQWTPLVHSQDIDAVVEAARSAARGGNVFLGGHSAGSGFVARYAATDFNLAGGEPAPGYKKLRGLLLIEGGGAGPSSESPDEATLDMIEARFDGGLYGAVRDQMARCIDGSPGNNAIAQVPQLNILTALLGTTPASSVTLLGKFLDDDGLAAGVASFLATSVGFEGPVVNGIATWLSKGETMPPEALIDNGPAPATLDDRRRRWGVEVEPTDLEGRLIPLFYLGETNFLDWYYPSSGLSVTTGLGLDTTPLSAPPPLGRGRTDIDNRTQGGAIDIPVIGFGGSNGLTPVPASFLGFADVIAPCAAASCDSMTQRVLDRANPNEVFPTFGGASGGYEVYISEGYSHVDILTADDEEGNQVIAPLLDFIGRNLQ